MGTLWTLSSRLLLLAFLTGFTTPITKRPQQTIVVRVADDRGKGIESELFLASSGGRSRIGSTDQRGLSRLAVGCKSGDLIIATPVGESYFSQGADCHPPRDTLAILVTAKDFGAKLYANSKYFERRGDEATAALGFLDLAVRLDTSDPELAKRARHRAWALLASKTYGRKPGWNLGQVRLAETPELRKDEIATVFRALHEIQLRKGIPEQPFGIAALEQESTVSLTGLYFRDFGSVVAVEEARAELEATGPTGTGTDE